MSPQNARNDAPPKPAAAIAAAIADAQSGLVPGARLDRYELLSPLAQGGMASVWLARLQGKHGFQKLVALKTIRNEFATDLTFRQMFLDEARIASGITHPNVAQIFDLGEHDGLLYLAMEWVDGDSLSKIQKTVQRAGHYFPVPFAVSIMADICNGLHAAHELRDETGRVLEVVHRDVSPSNVLVTREGIPKVIDFGIAKALGRVAEETSAGMLKGKIFYMAPEQAMGRAVDRRADVWAVGATLHTMLSGAPPFPGENEVAVLHKLMTGAAPTQLPPHVPPAIAQVLARSMSHDVLQRTPDCRALGYELRQAMRASGMEVDPTVMTSFFDKMLGDSVRERQSIVQHALEGAAGRNAGSAHGHANASAAHDPSSSGVSRRESPVSNGQMVAARAGALAAPHSSGAPPNLQALEPIHTLSAHHVHPLIEAGDDPTRSDPRFARLSDPSAPLPHPSNPFGLAVPAVTGVQAAPSMPSFSPSPSGPFVSAASGAAGELGGLSPFESVRASAPKGKWTFLHTLVLGLGIIAALATGVVVVMNKVQERSATKAEPANVSLSPANAAAAAPPATPAQTSTTEAQAPTLTPEPPSTAAAAPVDPAPAPTASVQTVPVQTASAPVDPKPVATSHAAATTTTNTATTTTTTPAASPAPSKPAKPKPAGNPDFGF